VVSDQFFKQIGCVGCHHQDATAFAVRAARSAGIPLDEAVARERVHVMKSSLGSSQELLLQGVTAEAINIQSNHLAGLWASGYTPDMVTDAAVVSLVSGQYTDGHWQRYVGAVRAPTGADNLVWTAEAVLAPRALRHPGPSSRIPGAHDTRFRLATKSNARSTYQHAFQLLALSAAGAGKEESGRFAARPTAERWRMGRQPNLGSDAHSTGFALHALRETGS
jgi:hypothetical protein